MEYRQELLTELYRYDEVSGKLFYKVRLAKRIKIGEEVGTEADGYLQTQLFGKMLKVHRIIWKLMYGVNPLVIDHINHDKKDNRLCNLRSVTSQENTKNMSATRKSNRLGVYGVYPEPDRNKFVTSVRVDGKVVGKKRFSTIEEAIEHRDYLYDKYDFHPNHGKL